MRPCTRGPVPDVLRDHGVEWSVEFAERRRTDPSARFAWRTYQGTSVRDVVLGPLKAMTDGHCAYCDGYPLDVTGRPTIDHFRPKSTHPELSYAWDNLFLACERCQEHKLDRFDDGLLRPDVPEYRFDRYFIYQEKSGDLRPHPGASAADQGCARITIDVFGLNAGGRPAARKRELRDFRVREGGGGASVAVADRAYRFLLEATEG